MRTFALVNGLGERVDLMSVEHFYYAPENLGFKRDITTRKVGNRWVLVNRTNAQLNPTGTVMFMGANPYADYFKFVQFCSVSPMILEYTPYEDTYKMRVEVSELEKTEINRNGILQCNAEFTPLTMFYKESSSAYIPTTDKTVGWIWGVTWGEVERHDIYRSITSSFVTIEDGAAAPVKDLTVSIEPVQSGSGDPSPTNVRPISGWTGVNVQRTGKNLLDDSIRTFYGQNIYFADTNTGTSLTLSAGTYTFSVVTADGTTTNMYMRDLEANANVSGFPAYSATSKTFTLTKKTRIRAWVYKAEYTSVNDIRTAQIESGTSATEYEPYNAQTYSVSFGEAGTVYGGTLDVTTGVLTVNMGMVDLSTLSWVYNSSGEYFYSSSLNGYKYIDENTVNAICAKYPVIKVSERYKDKTIFINTVRSVIAKDTSYTDAASFKTAMNGVDLVYEVASPQTYELTPTEVCTLLGVNNIWTDTGNTSVTYLSNQSDVEILTPGITWTNSEDMSLSFDSPSYEESPCKLVMYGPLVNPIWRHYVDGSLTTEGRVNVTVDEGNRLEVTNLDDPYSIKIYDADGNLVQNAYQLSDFSTDRFVTIKRGRNVIRVSDEGSNNVRLQAEVRIYHESV